MIKQFSKLILLTLFISFSGQSAVAADKYVFDKSHTSILFFIEHLGFSKMVGEFHDFDGHVMIDEENPENSSVDVTISMASVDTDVAALDEKLRGSHYFKTATFPEARFKSTSVELVEDGKATVTGDLTFLGMTKPLILDVTLNKIGSHPFSDGRVAGFSARGVMYRSGWQMMEGLPAVGDKVILLIETELYRDEDKVDT